MTIRQAILKLTYPVLMFFRRQTGGGKKNIPQNPVQPLVSFYSLHTVLNSNREMDFSSLKGKKVLLVNTASNCGYTNQYEDLQKLYEENKDRLLIIGFPANDFKEQEKGTDDEIAAFCKVNFGVSFPLSKKSVVVDSQDQHPVFRWLTHSDQNGWNNKAPEWNFSKYLVNEKGFLTHYFAPAVSPLSDDIMNEVKKDYLLD